MPAIGAHIPRADRQYAERQFYANQGVDVAAADAEFSALIRGDQYPPAVRIRARVAVALWEIAAQAERTGTLRDIRRDDARQRREEQRQARIAAGTDRALIRARRAVIATPARPGRITALNRFFGR